MARPLAIDYDDKRRAILKTCCRLFARYGYDRTSTVEIAAECGVSKALLYHYYRSKEDMLVAILDEHLNEMRDAIKSVKPDPDNSGLYLKAVIGAVLDCYLHADDEHKVQINELRKLPPEKANALLDIEREIVSLLSKALICAVPNLASVPPLIKPITMSVFGILNWQYLWFRADGAVSRDGYVDLVANMVLGGAHNAVEQWQRQGASGLSA